jgi:hypothetical protein
LLQFGDGGNPQIDEFPVAIINRFGLNLSALTEALGDLESVKTEAQSFIKM